MANNKLHSKDAPLDIAKLQALQDPLLLRVVKLKGNVEQPIELPSKEGLPPGAGWTRDEVLSLENWLLTRWSGGGYYRVTAVDARGQELVWTFLIDPRTWPERVPPNTQEASVMATNPTPPPTGPQPVPPSAQPIGSAAPSGWPPTGGTLGYGTPPHSGQILAFPQQQAQQQQPVAQPVLPYNAGPQPWQYGPQQQWQGPQPYGPQQQWQGPQPYGNQQYYGQPGQPAHPTREPRWRDDDSFYMRRMREREYEEREQREKDREKERAEREREQRERAERTDREREQRERDQRERELEAKIRQAEMDRKELEYKQQLERQQQQHTQQLQLLQDEIRRAAEQNRNKPEDEEVKRLREEAQRTREAQLMAQAEADRRAFEQRLQSERQALEAQFALQRQQSEQQLILLKDQLTRLAEAPRGETDEMRRLREEQERQRHEAERIRQEQERRLEMERAERERERERYERERRDEALQRELKAQDEARARRDEAMQREMNAQREAFERRIEAMQQQSRAQDPVLDMMKETARMQADQTREIARMQQDQTNRMANFMVAPMQLAQIMRDNSAGSDGLVKNVVDSIGGIVGMYKTAAEQVMQMSGGGGDPPAARLIQEGIGRASEMVDRYLSVKRDQTLGEVQVKKAQAQVEAARVQAHAQMQIAQRQATMMRPQPQWASPPPVAPQGSGLSGAGTGPGGPVPARPTHGPTPARPQNGTPANGTSNGASNGAAQQARPVPTNVPPGHHPSAYTDEVPPEPKAPSHLHSDEVPVEVLPKPAKQGPSEQEIFGPTFPSVQRLRKGVNDGQLTPEQAVDAILQGVEYVDKNQLLVPAFVLFAEERWADFIDVLIPEAPIQYRAECVRIMVEEVELVDPNAETPEDDSVGSAPGGSE